MKTLTPWNLVQLSRAMQDDLAACHTASERGMAEAMNLRAMRELHREIIASGRKLTPGEQAVVSQYLNQPNRTPPNGDLN